MSRTKKSGRCEHRINLVCYCCNLSGTFYICRVQFFFPAVVQSIAPCYKVKKKERYFEVMHAVLRYHIFTNSFLIFLFSF